MSSEPTVSVFLPVPASAASVAVRDDDGRDSTIAIPGLDPAERVVRPVLAILFRVAIGPRADRYAPRFLAFERSGRGFFSWHWPSLLVPSLWAFYRKLWLSGLLFAVLRLSAVAAFLTFGPLPGEVSWTTWGLGMAAALILPAIVPAALADWLLWRRVRALVRAAEACSATAAQAASRLNAMRPTAETTALLLSFAVLCGGAGLVGPSVIASFSDHLVRLRVSDTLAAVRWVQQQVEAGLDGDTPPGTIVAGDGARLMVENVDVDSRTGRVRVAFGPRLPELDGAWIVLAPALDPARGIRWICVPVGIAERHLPKSCRDG